MDLEKIETPEDVLRPGMVVYWRGGALRTPQKVQIDKVQKKWGTTIVTFSYEQERSRGLRLNAIVDLGKTNDVFYYAKSPVTEEQMEEIGLPYVPEVGKKYFEAKASFEKEAAAQAATKKAGRRKKRRSKTRRVKRRTHFKGT